MKFTEPLTLFFALSAFAMSQLYSGPALGASSTSGSVHCGTERWAAKGLTDGSTIDFNNPTSTTVTSLRTLARPNGVDSPSGPRTPAETHVYTIHALLQEYKIENDHDFHIVISDFGGSVSDTMIAEVPDPQCDGVSGDGWTKQFASIRSAIDSKFGTATGSMSTVDAEVTITGVLFFDFLHGQTGVAPNGVELHPVIGMSFGSAAPNVGSPTAAPTPANPTRIHGGASTTPSGSIAQFSTEAAAQAHCPDDVVVWLNTRTGIYHLKGHRYYGATSQGSYVCKQEADRAGDHEGF
jgi:hypothetical protein